MKRVDLIPRASQRPRPWLFLAASRHTFLINSSNNRRAGVLIGKHSGRALREGEWVLNFTEKLNVLSVPQFASYKSFGPPARAGGTFFHLVYKTTHHRQRWLNFTMMSVAHRTCQFTLLHRLRCRTLQNQIRYTSFTYNRSLEFKIDIHRCKFNFNVQFKNHFFQRIHGKFQISKKFHFNNYIFYNKLELKLRVKNNIPGEGWRMKEIFY